MSSATGMPRSPAAYAATERLRDGRQVEIRALKPDDRDVLMAAIGTTSAGSLYRRFFAPKRGFTEEETAFFLSVDFVDHVALVVLIEEGGRPVIVGGGRYIVVEPAKAELAVLVVDRYQGLGMGAALLRHLLAIGSAAGLAELIAEVLPENAAMLKVLRSGGFRVTGRDGGVVHLARRLPF